MASNSTTYTNTTPAEKLDKKTLNKMVWMSCQLQASFNYERMQACGWLWAMLPGLKKIHTNKEDLALSMTHNMDFFNTHPYFVTFVMGIVLSLEQQKADVNTIRAIRVAAMGPLGGIGDSLFWFALVPIVAGMTCTMAIDGSILGPILYFAIVFGLQMVIRFWLMYWSYSLGTSAITVLTANAKEFTRAASILGVFIVGALVANFGGGTQLGMMLPNGENPIDLQGKFNEVLPCVFPLGITMLCYWLIKKKGWTPVKCICLLLVIGIVGCALGIWYSKGGYTPLINVPWDIKA